ncbi:MAG: putative transport system permease protein [Chloroflexota bacterium]|jgi:putative ABC transport system permease protein|nr:putative transport system permease protein [Chloroflexota bacterium]
MGPSDLIARAISALLARPGRTILSALGVAVSIGALVGVLGISSTTRAGLLAQLSSLGDVLTVESTINDPNVRNLLPGRSLATLRVIPTVQAVAGIRALSGSAYRTDLIPADQTRGLSVVAFSGDIAGATGTRAIVVRRLDAGVALPEVLLGAQAAEQLGVTAELLPTRVWVSDRWLYAVGILSPTLNHSGVDLSVFVPAAYAMKAMDFDGNFNTIYVRAPLDTSDTVSSLLPATIDPSGTAGVRVFRASDALTAAADAATAFQSLLLALAAVGLLVAGFGIMNTLMVAVVERRAEIGIRRALGATRTSIALLFMTEGFVVATIGGLSGVVFGIWATLLAAWQEHVHPLIPVEVVLAGLCISLGVAAVASLYPALHAARMSPSEALRTMA